MLLNYQVNLVAYFSPFLNTLYGTDQMSRWIVVSIPSNVVLLLRFRQS